MSLMSKLLVTILVVSSTLLADNEEILAFFKKNAAANVEISVVDSMSMHHPDEVMAYLIQFKQKNSIDIQRETFYVIDGYLTQNLYNVQTGAKLKSPFSNKVVFNEKNYDKEHLISGNVNAKHKVVIFSDPLCPFCKEIVPSALSYMKKYPKTFAVYYYHMPLQRLHPRAMPLALAAIVAEKKGVKNVVENLYKVHLPRLSRNERGEAQVDVEAILKAFNTIQKTSVSVQEITAETTQNHLRQDMNVAAKHLVNSTPTMFFDGKPDPTKAKYKTVKTID